MYKQIKQIAKKKAPFLLIYLDNGYLKSGLSVHRCLFKNELVNRNCIFHIYFSIYLNYN